MPGPKKNTAFTFNVALTSQADTKLFKTSPTLAAGDITVSKDGGNFANIGTLPTQIQTTGVLPVALTADEMNADLVVVLFHDAAGAEWCDAVVTIHTETGTISEIDTNVDSILADTGTDGVVVASHTTAAKAEIEAEATDALNAYDPPTKTEMDAAHALLGTLANQSTLLARLGAITGTGVNTVLGFFKALLSKTATLPSDIGGTFAASTDSTEAIRDKLDTLPVTASQVAATGTAGELVATAFVKWVQAITLDTALSATWAKAYFSMKVGDADADDDAVVRVLVTNPASVANDGLVRLNGSGSTTKSQGSLAVAGDRATVTLTLADEAMAEIAKGTYTWDVKEIGAGNGESYRCAFGTVEIGLTTTRAVS